MPAKGTKKGPDGSFPPVEETPTAPPDPSARRRYWVGCDREGPASEYPLGGISFGWETAVVRDGVHGSVRVPRRGSVAYLTDAQVERCHRAAHREIVRPRPGATRGPRGMILDAARRDYRRMDHDYPIGMHCWIVPLEEGEEPRNDGTVPPRMIQDVSEWIPPERDPDPRMVQEMERARLQAQALREVMAEVRG